MRRGALPSNPVRDATPRRSARRPTKGPRALTREEARQITKAFADDSKAQRLDLADLVNLMLGTGMRIGEACAIRWPGVDPDAATVRIDATLIRIPGEGLTIQEFPKTTAGRRTIAVPAFVVDLLRRRQTAPRPVGGHDVVFRSPKGSLRDPHNTSSDLRRVLDRAGDVSSPDDRSPMSAPAPPCSPFERMGPARRTKHSVSKPISTELAWKRSKTPEPAATSP